MFNIKKLFIILLLLSGQAYMTLACAAAPVASMQTAIAALQSQIQQVENSVPKQLHAQQLHTQKQLLAFKSQVQQQLDHLQQEILQLQAAMTKQLNTVQKEVRQLETMH